jgi:tetratricopeptide (TPR) repeat protein
MKRVFNAVILIVAVLTASFLWPTESFALIGMKEGDTPRHFVLNDLNGSPVDTSGLIGTRPVILVFWKMMEDRSFLNYSLDELLFLEEFYKKYRDTSGLEILAIYTPKQDKDIPAEEIARVKDFIRLNEIRLPVLIDKNFKIFREYGIIALPSTVMVDKTGKISFIYPSFPLSAREVFVDKIKELVGIVRPVEPKKVLTVKGATPESIRLYNYSLRMYKKGLLEQAISPLTKSLSIAPDFPWALNLIGVVLWEQGNFKDAAEAFLKALAIDEKNEAVHFNYGQLLFENEEYQEAEKHLTRALELDNAIAEAHYVMGLLYKDTNRADEALKELKTALQLFENEKIRSTGYSLGFLRISTLYTLSELYEQAGDNRRAFALLQDATRIALGVKGRTDKGKVYKSKKLMLYE